MSVVSVSRTTLQVLYKTGVKPPDIHVTHGTRIIDKNDPGCRIEFSPYKDNPNNFDKPKKIFQFVANEDGTFKKIQYHEISGSNTKNIDSYRQGIELTQQKYRFLGVGPKIWAGNIKGCTEVRTLGQALQYTEAMNDKKYLDKQNFNPVEYVQNANYPYPIYLNEGPSNAKATRIQPLTIIGFLGDQDNDDPARKVCGNVEDGNMVNDELCGGNNRIEQFYNFESKTVVPFLEEGESYFGDAAGGKIFIEGYLNDTSEAEGIAPYVEDGNKFLTDKLSTNDNTILTVLKNSSSLNLDEDIRRNYNVKSAPAGGDVYGPDQSQYGTDSIAYSGYFRGS